MPPEKGIVQGKEESPNGGEGSLLQFKITLKGIRPPIWRRFLVPERLSLSDLHDVIQEVMGCWDDHLHQFLCKRKRYGVPDPEWNFAKVIDDSTVALKDLSFSIKDKILYEYDFEDGLEHELLVEKILLAEGRMAPVCLKGAQACPPEDCGGPWGYENLLEDLKNPEDEEYTSKKEWLSEYFDPEYFDLDRVNTILSPRKWTALPSRKRRKKSV